MTHPQHTPTEPARPVSEAERGADLMRRAYELAPFVAEALREVAAEAEFPDDTDERMWTLAQKESHQFAVDVAEFMLRGDVLSVGELLSDDLKAHAEAARDETMDDQCVKAHDPEA